MTHPIYPESALIELSVSMLEEIADQLGATPIGDTSQRDTWIQCILAHQSTITQASYQIPIELIEEKTLDLLGVEVVNHEDYSSYVVPEGEIHYQVFRFDELIGTISKLTIGGVLGYHPKNYNCPDKYIRRDRLFLAVCHLLPKQDLEVTYPCAFQILEQRFNSVPSYV